jgi:hypothetical protein
MTRTCIRIPRRPSRRLAQARERWRGAAYVVSLCWEAFVHADADSRETAFAAYLAALDAEEAAAAAIAGLSPWAVASP